MTLKRRPLVYPIEVTQELIDRANLQRHPFAKFLKLGHFIMTHLTKTGFTLPRHPKQYETEKSSAIAFHEQNKNAGYTATEMLTAFARIEKNNTVAEE